MLTIVGFYFFLANSFSAKRPFITMRIFRDWNFSVALVFMFIIGVILLATMALVTPFIQNLLGYPVLSSGYLLGTRGIGTFVAMFLVGRLIGKVDPRILIFIGLVLATVSLWQMVGWTTDVPARAIALNSIMQGFGLGFVFVPLNTMAFATLPGELERVHGALDADPQHRLVGRHLDRDRRTDRMTTMTTAKSWSTSRRSPMRCTCRTAGLVRGTTSTSAMLDQLVTQQAAAMAYSNDFLLMTLVTLAAFPLLALLRSPKAAAHGEGAAHAVMD